jgi:hypothetical protein
MQMISDSHVDTSGLGPVESDDQPLEHAITSEVPSFDPGTRVEFRDRFDGVSIASVVGVAPVDLCLGGILSIEMGCACRNDGG